jgi:putative FmdB family regulatory protein
MPIYEYKCDKGHVFEVIQSFSDEALTECEVCGAPVQKVFHPVSVHFKGSGFYNTDYGTRRRAREAKDGAGSDGSASSSDGAGGSSASEPKSTSSAAEGKAAAA